MVTCKECGREFLNITWTHLATHGITNASYRAKYHLPARGTLGSHRTRVAWASVTHLLGQATDRELAQELGCSPGAIKIHRNRLGIRYKGKSRIAVRQCVACGAEFRPPYNASPQKFCSLGCALRRLAQDRIQVTWPEPPELLRLARRIGLPRLAKMLEVSYNTLYVHLRRCGVVFDKQNGGWHRASP
jgi:hypothetical protein